MLANAIPAAAATSAPSCAARGHNAAKVVKGNGNEIDVSCSKAIKNGIITIRMNRGGTVAAQAKIVTGPGSLACSGQNLPQSSAFTLAITCTGSLPAKATAQVRASLGPNPCNKPAFSGDLTVSFGDVTTFGPKPLAAYDCSNSPGQPGGQALVVHDRRGDGAGKLDLRTVSVSIAHKRLILRFTCWNSFGPADMDHDAAHFNAQVTLGANDAPTHAFIAFFYWHGRPFAQAGTSQSFNPQVRYGRPNSHSIQLSVPLSTFGHPIHLWVLPSARGNREDIAPQLNIKVPK